MSTAALASARRRRTTNEPQVASQNVSTKTTQQESPNSSKQVSPPPQSLTPLQILQIHDNKLKDLEALLVELNSEDYITNVVEEKITELMQAKLSTFSNELDKVRMSAPNTDSGTKFFETKIQALETSIQNNFTIQNVRIDEFKNGIQENFNTFKDNTIKMIDLLNIKDSQDLGKNVLLSNISDSKLNVEKLDMVIKDVNELKLLVIKNQTLALETCNSIIYMKDEFKLNNDKIARIVEKLDTTNNMCCNEQQCDPAQMFIQSFMKNKLFGGANKINIDANYDDEYDDDDVDEDMNTKKLHIDLSDEQVVLDDEEIISDDSNIISNNNELIIDENQLQDILELNSMEEINLKQEVLDEIKNIMLVNSEISLEDNNGNETDSKLEDNK
jgi:hypothetical protein